METALETLSRAELEAEVLRLRRSGAASDTAADTADARRQALFEAIDDGFCIIEFFDGPHGALSDYRHVEANSGYERHTGIAGIVGKTLRDIAPTRPTAGSRFMAKCCALASRCVSSASS
jgi:hypothetical protein